MDPILVLAAIDTRRGKGKEMTLDSTYVLSISQYNTSYWSEGSSFQEIAWMAPSYVSLT